MDEFILIKDILKKAKDDYLSYDQRVYEANRARCRLIGLKNIKNRGKISRANKYKRHGKLYRTIRKTK